MTIRVLIADDQPVFRSGMKALLVRPKDIQDNATPSGNALAATALLQLATYGDRTEWRSAAEDMLASIQNAVLRYPTAIAQWLSAADFAIGPTREVAILGDLDNPETHELLKALWKSYRPRQVTAISAYSVCLPRIRLSATCQFSL